MQALHNCSFPGNTPTSCPDGFNRFLSSHSKREYPRCIRMYASKKPKAKKKAQQQQQQQQQASQPQAAAAWVDPRLQWAKPEWIDNKLDIQQPHTDLQQAAGQQEPSTSTSSSIAGIARIAAAARTAPQQRSKQRTQQHVLTPSPRDQQRLLQRMTYGSFSRSDEESDHLTSGSSSSGTVSPDSSSSSSNSSRPGTAALPQPFQALGIDFGLARVGVAVRQATYNIPLTTLWPQQLRSDRDANSDTSLNTSSSSSSGSSSSTFTSSTDSTLSKGFAYQTLAQVLLQTALERGCDGFVVGLPVYDLKRQQQAETVPASSAAAAAAAVAAGGVAGGGGQVWRSNWRVRK
jgi:hypothetical protein